VRSCPSVQRSNNPMLRYADAIGWDYVPTAEALRLRGGETGHFFYLRHTLQ
jgi:hypothetical protein